MKPQDRRLIGLQKAISAHEQAAAALTDLIETMPEESYRGMLSRIEQNIVELHAAAESSPGDGGG